jgi:hypothetical protein
MPPAVLSTSALKLAGSRGAVPSFVALQAGQGAPQEQAGGAPQGFRGWLSQTQPQVLAECAFHGLIPGVAAAKARQQCRANASNFWK